METEVVLEEAALPEKTLLSHHSMKTVMRVHQQLCLSFAQTLWYQQNIPPNQSKLQLSLFLSCYQTGVSLITHFYPLIGKASLIFFSRYKIPIGFLFRWPLFENSNLHIFGGEEE